MKVIVWAFNLVTIIIDVVSLEKRMRSSLNQIFVIQALKFTTFSNLVKWFLHVFTVFLRDMLVLKAYLHTHYT